jgi:hypothetical protein
MTDDAPEPEKTPDALPSRSSAGGLVAGILGTLESALTNRPRPVASIEERYRDPWASVNGVTVEGLDQSGDDRPEPPDRSGAKL